MATVLSGAPRISFVLGRPLLWVQPLPQQQLGLLMPRRGFCPPVQGVISLMLMVAMAIMRRVWGLPAMVVCRSRRHRVSSVEFTLCHLWKRLQKSLKKPFVKGLKEKSFFDLDSRLRGNDDSGVMNSYHFSSSKLWIFEI